MTYTEACKHNTKFNLKAIFKADKEYEDGANLEWIVDPMGRIGYIKARRVGAFLVHYPVKSFKVTIKVYVQSWDMNDITYIGR